MAAKFDRSSVRMTHVLNTGTNPVSGRPMLKRISIAVRNDASADDLDAVRAKVAPLLVYPTSICEASMIDILGED